MSFLVFFLLEFSCEIAIYAVIPPGALSFLFIDLIMGERTNKFEGCEVDSPA